MTSLLCNEEKEVYSFSRLTTFHQCKYQYFLNYIADPKPEKAGSAYAANGSFVHSLLEGYEKGEYALFELADLYEKGYDENVPYPFPVIRGVDQQIACYEDCLNFFNNFDGIDDKYEIIGAEDHFEELVECSDMKNFYIQGFIDLALHDKTNNDLILWDWKSTKNMTKKVLEEKEKQLYIYALRIFRKYGRFPDKLVFFSFRANKEYKIKFDPKKYDKYLLWMKSTVQQIRKCTDWYKEPNMFFCENLCDFREICDK